MSDEKRARRGWKAGAWASLAMLAITAGAAAAKPQAADQASLDALAANMGYRFEVIDNSPGNCPGNGTSCFLSTLTLTMPDDLPAGIGRGLELYFSIPSPMLLVESDVFAHQWLNGDRNRLTLRPGARLDPGKSYTLKLWGAGKMFSAAFPMPNSYLVADGLTARTIAATRPVIDPATGLETLPFVAPFTNEANLATAESDDQTRWLTAERAFDVQQERQALSATDIAIVPRPTAVERPAGAPLDLRQGVDLALQGIARHEVAPALAALQRAGVARFDAGPKLTVTVDRKSGIAAEGYRLNAAGGRIAIRAADAAGAAYALRTLAQQAAFEQGRLRPIIVADAPRYGFRGLHIDLGRNFHGKAEILKLVEGMAAYKLNRLHLHLAEDEGWRLEIPALPELAEIGSRRCHDPSEQHCLLPQLGAGQDGAGPVNGYLTRADYIEIVRAADARHIEVIPSIDMPGHSRAAIRAMEARYDRLSRAGDAAGAAQYRLIDPQDRTRYLSIQNYTDNTLNVCLPSTYAFVDTVVDEIAAMHRDAGQPLKTFHLGADETAGAWVDSPACKPMLAELGIAPKGLTPVFIERVAASLAKKGLRTAGWSDGMGHTQASDMPAKVQTNIWGVLHTGSVFEAHDQANRGWDVVLSIPNLGYFDMPYAPHPQEGGYDWATRGIDTYQVFGFMPGNLPANAALIRNIKAQAQPIPDSTPLQQGRGFAGVQAQLWSETVRTDAGVEYMLFPRLLALAERGWSAAPWEPAYVPGASYEWHDPRVDRRALAAGWSDFAGRVAAQLPMLDALGIAYRVAPPGARVQGGMLEANSVFPGTALEYRPQGGVWLPYQQPVRVAGPVELRARSADGRRASRTVTVGE